jgi:hypothetical protein
MKVLFDRTELQVLVDKVVELRDREGMFVPRNELQSFCHNMSNTEQSLYV